MLTSDFDYQLPEELIASEPLADRSASRMLVVHRESGTIEHRSFTDLPKYLRPDDLLVLNDTRVLPARYFSNDGSKELLRLTFATPTQWRCMVKPGKKLRVGHTITIGTATGTVKEIYENGDRFIEFDQVVDETAFGHLALPPYMEREERTEDKERYQTVFAKHEGSIAAPTAGLHFTPELLATLPHTFVTLHVGVGTFQPVKADRITDHVMHSERYFLNEESARRINEAGRVIAVGTTATRVLESIAQKHGELKAADGETSIFIYPPYEFKVVDALVTNFHLPKSTLMMLVSALAGKDLIFRAYEEAIHERYRFYSYGDCMLIL
ncbi:tRNA preQ1(34) S-adenosylmethionine ribosyltransferase-isomerase QueA [Verrucomicrobium sp. BvORR034]|uniref:tRNA preQ1(34) S-adenosylmethionine ribosyltransferase-isomerase QueA n=1 Tax=Verrucomicrobium sp. BvORR034 TaxID=1396418 RepID=UPI00067930C8|nr:tRNA preQ1(34) S-adenosylmethionine ribosyltransferase-isomerase QueA [Verrucomicrobium sp. BvORR034]